MNVSRRPSTSTSGPSGKSRRPRGSASVFHRMRRLDPVHRGRTLEAWLVTRNDDVLRGLRDPRLSSDCIPSILDAQVAAGDRGSVRDFERTRRTMMVNMDGPATTGCGGWSTRLHPDGDRDAQPMIQTAVYRLLDRAEASPGWTSSPISPLPFRPGHLRDARHPRGGPALSSHVVRPRGEALGDDPRRLLARKLRHPRGLGNLRGITTWILETRSLLEASRALMATPTGCQ